MKVLRVAKPETIAKIADSLSECLTLAHFYATWYQNPVEVSPRQLERMRDAYIKFSLYIRPNFKSK